MSKRDKNNGKLTNKQINAMRRWNKVCFGTVLIMVIAALAAAQGQNISLHEAEAHGFLYWFLLCCAYPALEILSIINVIFGTQHSMMINAISQQRSVISLAVTDVICVAAIWWVVRAYLFKKFGISALRTAFNLMLMLLSWGALQLSLFALYSLWQEGGFKALHGSAENEVRTVKSSAALYSTAAPDAPKKENKTEQ